MREERNFHTALFKIQRSSKTCRNDKFSLKTLRVKADFFLSQLLYDVIDLKETRQFIQNCLIT